MSNDLTNPMPDEEATKAILEFAERVPDKAVPVVVTTEYRGIFFGYAVKMFEADGTMVNSIALWRCRNCIFFSADMKGFGGLSSMGPSAACKIGPPMPVTGLAKVTSISRVSEEAVRRWEAAPWATDKS